jgi:hypothetical protein
MMGVWHRQSASCSTRRGSGSSAGFGPGSSRAGFRRRSPTRTGATIHTCRSPGRVPGTSTQAWRPWRLYRRHCPCTSPARESWPSHAGERRWPPRPCGTRGQQHGPDLAAPGSHLSRRAIGISHDINSTIPKKAIFYLTFYKHSKPQPAEPENVDGMGTIGLRRPAGRASLGFPT